MTTMFSPADDFGIYDLLPEIGGFLGDIRFYFCLFLLITPILMVGIGALRFFRPSKKANRSVGYRTYFGMGSTYAWRVTQFVSGAVFMAVGGLLLVLAIIQCIVMAFQDVSQMAEAVYSRLILEGVCLIVSIIAVEVVIFLQFDRQGNLRKGRRFFFLKYVSYEEQPAAKETQPEVQRESLPEEPEMSDQELFTQEDFFDFDALLADNSVPTENPKKKE